MLVSQILRSMDPKVAATIPYFEEAKRLWDYLEKRFCVSNGPRLQQLRAKITDCKLTRGMSIEDYYTKLMGLFDDLTRLKLPHGCACGQCTCDIAGKYDADKEQDVLHQFLISVDDDLYATVRTNLLSQQLTTDKNCAYQAILQEEESHRIARGKIHQEQTKDATHVFALSSDCGQGSTGNRDKSKLYCSHCRKSGHDNSGCFVLHGYPDWWLEKYGGASKGVAPSRPALAAPSSDRGQASSAGTARANAVGSGVSASSSSFEQETNNNANVSLTDLKPEHVRVLLNMVNNC